MRTVKELSELTGISVRTLHYYDEIGLLKPTEKSGAGYRLYDDKALELLQQILFFREFDIPLKEIKSVMDNPDLDGNQILQMQRKMLVTKKERMERLITSIDDILKGENKMDFEVFSKPEVEELWESTVAHMPEAMRESIITDFGSLEQWRSHYMQRCAREDVQKGYQKMVEWYGGKESALKFLNHPPDMEVLEAFKKRADTIMQKLEVLKEKGIPVDSFEVKEVIGEYGFIVKQLYQVRNAKELMVGVAQWYKNEMVKKTVDGEYGQGMAEFFAQAVEGFYQLEEKGNEAYIHFKTVLEESGDAHGSNR